MLGDTRFLHLRSSSRAMLLLLGVTLAASMALCVLTWRLSVLDRAVQQQRTLERVQQAADFGSTVLLQQFAKTGDRLRVVLEAQGSGRYNVMQELAGQFEEATGVLAEAKTLKLLPERRLRYVPDPLPPTALPEDVFAEGEVFEYGRRDYDGASRWFRNLASHSQRAIRAGALLRAARKVLCMGLSPTESDENRILLFRTEVISTCGEAARSS